MPILDIKLTESTPRKDFEQMIKEVSEIVAKHQKCPISAVSICITEVPLNRMGQGGSSWRAIEDATDD